MRLMSTRILTTLGFSFCFAAMTACGGTKHDAKAPTTTSAEAPRGGSSATPDPSTTNANAKPEAPAAPVGSAAAASTKEDGSDIIPPFPSAGKEPAKEAKESKKAAKASTKKGKPKKKG
jgi:hypothetical protein